VFWEITPTGREAFQSEDASIPGDYRRLLSLIALHGDTKVILDLLSVHPEPLVRDWLRELEELGFIRSEVGESAADRTIPMSLSDFAAASREAATHLGAVGAYLASPAVGGTGKPRGQTAILIVEDDPDQLALADLRVTMAGYQVRTAATVKQMVRSLVEQGVPDLMLLDVMLPDGDGFDVLEKVRRHPDFKPLPIVMLTAKHEPEDIAKGLALGANGYVTKPYSKSVLAGVVSGVLESSSG
jgi:CheY-like chemotaxis protein